MCSCSGRSAAIRSAARRSSATSRAAKASPFTPRPARTSSTSSTIRSGRSRSSGTRAAGAEAAAPYTVKLTMEVEDRKGVLAAVSAKIADINTNIKNMEARTGGRESARAHRRHRGDQRPPAPREGDQVAAISSRRAGCRTGGTRELTEGLGVVRSLPSR